jgi:hypothetical protein
MILFGWPEIRAVLDRPRVVAALDIVGSYIAVLEGTTWDAARGLWSYGGDCHQRTEPPQPDTFGWYHACHRCHEVNVLSAVVGAEIAPQLHWRVLTPGDQYHSAGVGFEDLALSKPQAVCDFLWHWEPDEKPYPEQIWDRMFAKGAPTVWCPDSKLESYTIATEQLLPLVAEITSLMEQFAELPAGVQQLASSPAVARLLFLNHSLQSNVAE